MQISEPTSVEKLLIEALGSLTAHAQHCTLANCQECWKLRHVQQVLMDPFRRPNSDKNLSNNPLGAHLTSGEPK
jgi:hypothetical protein